MYKDGQIINKEEHIAFANWVNANGGGFYSESNGDGTYTIHKTPEPTPPTNEEQSENRRQAYISEIDPITAYISRLKDEEQTEDIIAEIETLKSERSAKIQEIKERFPYAEEPEQ